MRIKPQARHSRLSRKLEFHQQRPMIRTAARPHRGSHESHPISAEYAVQPQPFEMLLGRERVSEAEPNLVPRIMKLAELAGVEPAQPGQIGVAGDQDRMTRAPG